MSDRRDFLKSAGGVALAAAGVAATDIAQAQAQAQSGRRKSSRTPDVVVVGAGAFGGWAALCLQERGLKVLSLDAYGPSNPLASSAGEGRQIRASYGDDIRYTRWATQALKLWESRQEEFGRTLLDRGPRLQLANKWSNGLLAQRKIFDQLKIPYEIMDRAQLRVRYPQMNFDDVEFAFVETATSAAVKARESMILVSETLRKKGGAFRIARAMPGPATGRRMTAVDIGNGETISGGQFVFACGPWSGLTLPKEMGRVTATRSEYHYWGVPQGDDRFSWPNLPDWSDGVAGGYGFADRGTGLKFAPSKQGRVVHNPDSADRLPDPRLLQGGREYLAHRFPAMRNAPSVGSHVCSIERVGNEDFVIDRHPDYDNVWIASGGGGHGFKHGPLAGEYIADRVMGRKSFDPDAEKAFSLDAHPVSAV